MDISDLRYDPISDLWVSKGGERFLKNTYREDEPVWIEVGSASWHARYLNDSHRLKWPKKLPSNLKAGILQVLLQYMKHHSPVGLGKISMLLRHIEQLYIEEKILSSEDSLGKSDFVLKIWARIPSHCRSFFRELYKHLADLGVCGASPYIAQWMQSWKARNNVQVLREVLQWDAQTGALSTAELEIARRALEDFTADNDDLEHFVRVTYRIFLATLRRPSQILQIRVDGLKEIRSDVGLQYFLRIPKAKGQAAAEAEWESIPAPLARDIRSYRERCGLGTQSQHSDVLLPYLAYGTKERAVGTRAFNRLASIWFDRKPLISPRTKRPLIFGATRLRHTGATQMAMQGYSRQLIQDVLQHDSPESAKAYIDSVGADVLPLFERMDDRLGSRFSDIKNAWFKGQIVDGSRDYSAPVIVPVPSAPAIIGACSNRDRCSLHPLFSCYTCQHFLAFRQADHTKALGFVEQEYRRWRDAEISASRSKAMKDFERTAAGVRDVMDRIKDGNTAR